MPSFRIARIFPFICSFAVTTILPLVAASVAGAETTSAIYLVFTLSADGRVTPAHAAEVTIAGSLGDGRPTKENAGARRDADSIAIRVDDATGAAVFRGEVEVPRIVRGEFHGGEGGVIDGHVHEQVTRPFVVRLPAVDAVTLEIAAPGSRRPQRFSVPALLGEYRSTTSARDGGSIPAPAPLEGWTNGDPAHRVDLLVLGDGFTASQEAAFTSAALEVMDGMFSISPYSDYRNYVNAAALFTPSLEEGADQPPYQVGCTEYGFGQTCCADSSAASVPPRFVDTAFDATYCTRNIQRLLTVNGAKVFAAAAAVPDWDQVIVIVNSPVYGGSGGGLSVISLHGSAIEVAQHEYGHTFAALADEYTTPYPGYPPCSDTDDALPSCERNVTNETDRDFIKWAKWIDPLQAVPSAGQPPLPTDAGLWSGARYVQSGMYRQGYICIMRALGRPFCDVAAEAYVQRLYEGGWGIPLGGIDVIEPGSETPAPGDVVVAFPGTTFSARVFGPEAGPDLDVRWLVDEVEVDVSTAESGAIVSHTLDTTLGDHVVQLRVTDMSSVLHPTTRPGLTRVRTWNVEVASPPTTTVPGSTTSTMITTTTTLFPSSSTTTSVTSTTATVTTTTTEARATTTTTLGTSSTTSSTSTTLGTTTTTLDTELRCAQPVSTGPTPVATDCLYLLNAAVGLAACTPECLCAPKGALPVLATDTLVCLTAAVGGDVELRCPCGPFP
jgi:hypothetical protein